jgi:hypothetical protein
MATLEKVVAYLFFLFIRVVAAMTAPKSKTSRAHLRIRRDEIPGIVYWNYAHRERCS